MGGRRRGAARWSGVCGVRQVTDDEVKALVAAVYCLRLLSLSASRRATPLSYQPVREATCKIFLGSSAAFVGSSLTKGSSLLYAMRFLLRTALAPPVRRGVGRLLARTPWRRATCPVAADLRGETAAASFGARAERRAGLGDRAGEAVASPGNRGWWSLQRLLKATCISCQLSASVINPLRCENNFMSDKISRNSTSAASARKN